MGQCLREFTTQLKIFTDDYRWTTSWKKCFCFNALVPTISAGLPNSIELTSATMNTGTTLHTAPPSPSLSDSYARAHPDEVKIQDMTRLNVAIDLGPSLLFWNHRSSPQMLGNRLSPNLQVPPQLLVVDPTPILTPHPTPPTSPLSTSSTRRLLP